MTIRDLPCRLSSWRGRLETILRLTTFGSGELENSPHEPLPDPERPGFCRIEGLEVGDPLHDRHLCRRSARRGRGDMAQARGWR